MNETRMARCGCGKELPTDTPGLAFWEDCGPESRNATEHCKHCGYTDFCHPNVCETNPITRRTNIGFLRNEHDFEPRGDIGYDRFYCGCRGWD